MKKKKEITPWDKELEGLSDLEKINAVWPTHSRTSCNDTDLYNAGSIYLRHRCDRCEALSQLQFQELKNKTKVQEELAKPEQEPVAWRKKDETGRYYLYYQADGWKDPSGFEPLYLAAGVLSAPVDY